ncbi:putative DUF1707 family protein/predicted membrane protein (DUF2154) [Corynebacterium mustelae]|uniref:Putative DUF1707 family protein/predicted membrane protein (DUF2154) n=1 Tax=Corynebacterium mustelae TaxID=571915 RepID=A0A0G3GYZ4_9CORY|nr:DUF1707 domain-containing protein [Corynebacterium mustelae]AKK04758.1 putative DUF1707 family protein/predicted membrane protein (DUF2154) [Corynebacterium mustelae]
MSDSNAPRTRASSFQRTTVSNALRFAFDDGQLDFAEYTTRNEKALQATYRDELPTLTADLDLGPGLPKVSDARYLESVSQRFQLPIMPDQMHTIHSGTLEPRANSQPATPTPPSQSMATHVTNIVGNLLAPQGASKTGKTLSIFAENSRSGSWVCAREHTVVSAFGESVIDLTTAQFESPVTNLTALSLLGEITIIVPDTFQIKQDVVAILGEAKIKDSGKVRPMSTIQDPDAPTLVISGLAALGTVKIKRVPSRRN